MERDEDSHKAKENVSYTRLKLVKVNVGLYGRESRRECVCVRGSENKRQAAGRTDRDIK